MTNISPLSALAAATTQEISFNPLANKQPIQKSTLVSGLLNSIGLDTIASTRVSGEFAAKEYYRKAMERYRKNRGAKLTRVGRMALEALQTLRPSVSRILEHPYLDDCDMGVITGRTILSLVKEGAQQRPGCVLTSHYLIDLLHGQNQVLENNSCVLNYYDATQKITHQAIDDLTRVGLIERQICNETQLLTPYSEREAGQEKFYAWLIERYQKQHELTPQIIREKYLEDIQKVDKDRYLLEIGYFTDSNMGVVTGWDLLSLLIESDSKMLGSIPSTAITQFFDTDKTAAAMNGIDDLARKLNLLDIHFQEDPQGTMGCYYTLKPYTANVLALRFKHDAVHSNTNISSALTAQFKAFGQQTRNLKSFLV